MYNKRIKEESERIQERTRELIEEFGFKPTVSRATGRYNAATRDALSKIEAQINIEFSHVPKDRRRRNVTKVTRSIKPEIEA